MCGLALCIGKNHEENLLTLINHMTHRGIRSRAEHFATYSLGHVRLPIQGLDPEFDQPFRDQTLFVGEIFNYKTFGDYSSDIEAVHDLMMGRIPIQSFEWFDGFWSIVHIDGHRRITGKRAHIFTDHLAKKPLYIMVAEESVAICSEILPLMLLLDELEWDQHNMSATAKWGYHPAETTPFKNIMKIPANCHMILNMENLQVEHILRQNLQWPRQPTRELRTAIEEAVKNRLVSDVPVSLLVSGGLDSTIVYYLTREFSNQPLTVFHVDNDEAEWLNYIDFSGVELKQIELEGDDLLGALAANQTPVDLGSMLPQYLLGRAIRKEGFDVAISGDGADELFGGYRRIAQYDSQYTDIFDELVYYHLPRLDRLMMASTVELRSPFLAPDVVNNALQIPYERRMNKRILKKTFADIVPQAIQARKKEALKIPAIRQDKMSWRLHLINQFKGLAEEMYYEHQRCN